MLNRGLLVSGGIKSSMLTGGCDWVKSCASVGLELKVSGRSWFTRLPLGKTIMDWPLPRLFTWSWILVVCSAYFYAACYHA